MRVELRVGRRIRTVFDDDGSAVLLGMHRRGHYMFLNSTAGYLWRLLIEDSMTFEAALAATASRYGVTVARLSADLQPVITKMCQRKLLVKRKVSR